jgi:cytochrome c553
MPAFDRTFPQNRTLLKVCLRALFPGVAVLGLLASAPSAADESVKEKVALCTPCHGEAGVSKPKTPHRWRDSLISSYSGN